MRHLAAALVLSSSAFAFAAPAIAQDAASPATEEAGRDESAQRSEIVVTADRREQTLQEYAGTAAAFTGDDLKKRGVQDLTDLNDVLPGLSIANNGNNIEVYIRGVDSSNNTELGDPAAATHFDGVYIPRPAGIGSAFFDIQRVEVNVGPQGTLRGRNATAGSVNAISWKPGLGVWDTSMEVEYGSYDQVVVNGMINVPLGEKAAFRLAGSALRHDSYYKNVGPVREIDVAEKEDNKAFRAQLLFEPTDRLRFLLAGEFMHETGTGYTGSNYANPLGNGIDPDDIKDPRKVVARAFTPDLDIKHYGIRLEVGFETDTFTVDYLGSYRDVVSNYVAATPISPFYPGVLDRLSERDNIFTPAAGDVIRDPVILQENLDNFSRFQSITDSHSHYHELRIHNDEGPFIWSLGGLYFKEDQYAYLGSTGDRGLFFQGVEFNMPDVDAESYAGFADATYEVDNRLRLTAGIRYTDDRKSREGVAARYGLALGGGSFECCGGVRYGTEGFQFAGRDRTIFNPDTSGDGIISDAEVFTFIANGVKQFGIRDNLDEILAFGPKAGNPFPVAGAPVCVDTVSFDSFSCQGFTNGDPFFNNQFTYSVPFQGQIFRQSGKIKTNFVDWRLRADFDITERNKIYALVATGNKSGGFNDNLGDTGIAPTYDGEKVTLYELGSKNEFWIGNTRARLNGSLFYNDYKDQVLTSLLSVAQAVEFLGGPQNVPLPENTSLALVVSFSYNAANSEIYGANLEGGFDFPDNWSLDFNALYLEANVVKAQQIQDFRFQADVAPTEAVFQSINGRRLPRTPKWQLNASLSKVFEMDNGSFDFIVSGGYRSKQYMTIFNSEDFQNPNNPRLRLNDKVGGYFTVDLGAGYTHGADGKLRFEAYVNNLTDAVHEAAIIITQFDNTRFFTRPRTYGGRVRVKF